MIVSSDLPTPFCAIKEDMGLPIFLGGGGSISSFYKNTIIDTYKQRGLKDYRIPPFALTRIPKPSHLEMGLLDHAEYHRFLIAFGLTIFFGTGPEYTFPSEHEILKASVPDPNNIRTQFDPFGHNQN